MRRAFSILELLVIVLIIAVLVALMQPVINNAVVEAKKARSTNNMKQIHTALMLYVEEYGLNAPYDLPARPLLYIRDERLLHTGGTSRMPGVRADVYRYMMPGPPDGTPSSDLQQREWVEHIARTGGTPILIVDDTQHSSPSLEREYFIPTFALGCYFDGHVARRRKLADPGTYKFWE